MKRSLALVLLTIIAAVAIFGMATTTPNKDLRVFAAASLSDVLPRVATAWSGEVSFNFDATSRIARQIEAGAPADLFFSADGKWMDKLEESGLVIPETRSNLMTNRLVLIASSQVQAPPTNVTAMTDHRFESLALAGEAVPAGRYAREALKSSGIWDTMSTRVIEGHTVRTVLRWVSRGEVPIGVVYRTDALVDPKVIAAFTFPAQSHTPIVYPAAVVKQSGQRQNAASFLEFCESQLARSIFEEAGFTMLATR
ncbi:MAG: molybdate ABC transporter substrate-binding protein [Proteobacteria bacterium]|nr:molybdate ABC transporter substrate-binding protein [Pseudomonadota bacterium]